MRTSKNLIEDLSFGVFTIILFVVCWVQVGKAAEETQVMPHLVIVLGLACTIGMMLKACRKKDGNEKKQEMDKKQILVGVCVFLFITLLMVFVKYIGMYVCVYLAILAISLTICYFEHGWDTRRFLRIALYDLVVLAVSYLLFGKMLQINTPKGFLM